MQSPKKNFTDRNVLILLMLILVLGSLLRFYGLENQSFWNDELAGWKGSNYDSLSKVINEGIFPDHPPGYHIFLYFVQKYVGDSESILRLPSAISGILSVFVVFLLGLRLYSYQEGLIASALTSFLWFPVYYSQEARAYSMLLLTTAIATYFWILILKGLNEKASVSYYIICGYIVAATISSYLHYYGLYLAALQALGAMLFFVRRRRAMAYILLTYLFVALACLPLTPRMWHAFNMGPTWIEPPKSTFFATYIRFLFNKSRKLVFIPLILYSFLFLRTVYDVWKSKELKKLRTTFLSSGSLLVLWLFVPYVGMHIKSVVSAPCLLKRHLIISLPAAYLLTARSITQLPFRPKSKAIVTFLIVGLFLYQLLFRMDYYSKPHKEQFREAVGFIVEHHDEHENSLIIGHAWHADYFNYYFERKGSDLRVNVMGGLTNDIPKVAELIARQGPKYVWFISAHRVPDEQFMQFLSGKLQLVCEKDFLDANVWLFQNR